MKKLVVLFSLLLGLMLPTAAYAEDFVPPDFFVRIQTRAYDTSYYNESILPNQDNNETTYYIKNQAHTTKAAMLIESGRTMLPLRLVGEACGADVNWNEQQQTATIKLGKRTAVVQPGSSIMQLNGQPQVLDTPPLLQQNTIYLPLRAVGEALGKKVDYQNKLGQCFVYVCDPQQDYNSRSRFNQLLSQTYLKDILALYDSTLLDVGQSAVITIDSAGDYYRNFISMKESVHWFDYTGSFPQETADMTERLNCKFRFYIPPSPNAQSLIAFYADGDAKIIYDVPSFRQFNACIFDDYVYIVDTTNANNYHFYCINMNIPQDQYPVPEEIAENQLPNEWVAPWY